MGGTIGPEKQQHRCTAQKDDAQSGSGWYWCYRTTDDQAEQAGRW